MGTERDDQLQSDTWPV